MGFSLLVETGIGEILRIRLPEGGYGGKSIQAFFAIYSGHINDFWEAEAIETIWFKELESKTKVNLRRLAEIVYAGDWDYGEGEFEKFRVNHPTMYRDMNEEDFKRSIKAVYKMWTPVNKLIPMVEELLRIFPEMGEETHWYSPKYTIDDFKGLLETFELVRERHGEDIEVRLKGD